MRMLKQFRSRFPRKLTWEKTLKKRANKKKNKKNINNKKKLTRDCLWVKASKEEKRQLIARFV